MSRLPASFAKHLKPVRRPATPPSVAKKTVNGVDELLRRAKEFHDKGDFTQAEKHCVAALARDPGNPQALLLAGSLARGVDDFGLALVFFRKALARQPKSVETHLVLAAT
ncbi:hypothetical protein, partial [Mesorhizobium marinum]|uniref:hypothetical protein n=1 Tax=Mesorhizobium marinum TaxID=3228790 RepID=UPI0034B180E7